jgi:hypothetical protein
MEMREEGRKDDADKPMVGLMIAGFPRALYAVAEVTTYGAQKYAPGNWVHVVNKEQRYTDALYRHLLKAAAGERCDPESGLPHLAHAAWNILALLEMSNG